MSRDPRPPGKRATQRRERRAAFPTAVPKARKTAVGRATTADTPLHVRMRGFEPSPQLEGFVRRRVAFKLGKFGRRIQRITVRIEDTNGPKGGVAYTCKVKVVIPRHGEVVQTEDAATPRAAFTAAIDAAERTVRRGLDRARPSTARAR